MEAAYICDAIRTPFGRYGGSLASIRADDLAAIPIAALMARNAGVDWAALDDVIYGCANQAGEDNRNVARMALLLAGLPKEVPGYTVNRLCASSMEAIAVAARAIKSGEADLVIAGGVESMSRAPFVVGKPDSAFSRAMKMEDTTMGWRFANPLMKARYGTDTMPETAEIVAEEYKISRQDQDAFALRSQKRAAAAMANGILAQEIVPVPLPQKKGQHVDFSADEQPRPDSSLEDLAKLKGVVKPDGTVTAGNASGINDGACAVLLASEAGAKRHGSDPAGSRGRFRGSGRGAQNHGNGPSPATRKALSRAKLSLDDVNVVELNEAFASQALAVLRELHVPDDAAHINPNGGAIALGHPLGASGARLIATATYQLSRTRGKYALCSMCIGVGQGQAIILERV